METGGKRDQGKFYQHALLHHQAVLHFTLPPLPLHLLIIIIILLLLFLIQALPPLLHGPVGHALASSSPRFQNIDRF